MISIKDLREAGEVMAAGGVDILDVKNPAEGTLGANTPGVIEEVMALAPKGVEIAASIGDLDFRPGTASLAAFGTATLEVDYVTASMFAVRTPREVGVMAGHLRRAIDEYDPGCGLIISGYADAGRIGAADPFDFVDQMEGADILMVDTAIKDGKNVLDFAPMERLSELKERAHDQGMELILAGSIRIPHLEEALRVDPDILGFRGVVCQDGEARREKVTQLKAELKRLLES
jgi:uncharacterized protein (UPF0264 family)